MGLLKNCIAVSSQVAVSAVSSRAHNLRAHSRAFNWTWIFTLLVLCPLSALLSPLHECSLFKFKLPSDEDLSEVDNQCELKKISDVWDQKSLSEILFSSLVNLVILFNFPSWFWWLVMLGKVTQNRRDLPNRVTALYLYCIEIGPN